MGRPESLGAVLFALPSSQPSAQPDQAPRNEENDHGRRQDSEAVSGHNTMVLTGDVGVEKWVHVEALGGVGDVCDAEIECEHGHEKR